MSDVSLRPLGSVVFGQLADVLWQAKAFEAPLAAALTPERWDAGALAAETVPADRLERIRAGGLGGGGAGPRDVAELVAAELRRGDRGLIVIEDMADPGDAFLTREQEPYEVIGDTIIYVAREPDVDVIEQAWRRSTSAAGHVGLVTAHALPVGEDAGYDVAASVVAATMVVLKAYDGEGALVFTRR
jgi:hypothetical protein